MPIDTGLTKVQTLTQADGSLSVIVRLYDQDAREYMRSLYAPAGFNVQGRVDSMVAELNEQLAAQEFEQIVGL
jgi:hypothetical protein